MGLLSAKDVAMAETPGPGRMYSFIGVQNPESWLTPENEQIPRSGRSPWVWQGQIELTALCIHEHSIDQRGLRENTGPGTPGAGGEEGACRGGRGGRGGCRSAFGGPVVLVVFLQKDGNMKSLVWPDVSILKYNLGWFDEFIDQQMLLLLD